MGGGTFEEVQRRRMDLVGPAADEFLSMMGLAELHFGKAVNDTLLTVWRARAELTTDVMIQLQTGDLEAYSRVYQGGHLKKLEALQADVLRILRPFALPE
jgi:hypothetical protein